MEVGRRRRAADLKSQQSHLVVNGVGSSWRLEDDPSRVVLHTLTLPGGVGWSTTSLLHVDGRAVEVFDGWAYVVYTA